jgi:hypothetical protein
MSKNAAGTYFQRIHALDLVTAAEEFNGPIEVKATYPGDGDGSTNGTVRFDPGQYKDRPGLMLLNGNLYTSWGSHCDRRPYGGWLITYNELTLAQTGVLEFAPNGSEAAPWNSGAAPAADAAGNVYLSLGNGTLDTSLNSEGFPAQGDYGNSLVKLVHTGNSLVIKDFWSMDNSNAESERDVDLGSGGIMLLPDLQDAAKTVRQLAVAAGKDGNLYVADRTSMGHFDSKANATIYQELAGALPGGIWGSPAYFNSHVYYGAVGQNLRSFEISEALLRASPVQTTSTVFNYPGTTPSVSSYTSGNGIVWAPENSSPAVLHAYDANNLATELYNSAQAANGRDQFGNGNKFVVPTIANGKVYVGSQNSVGIFGLLRLKPAPVADGDHVLSSSFSNLVLEAGSAANGQAIEQAAQPPVSPAVAPGNEGWFFASNGSGAYTIQSVSSGLFLADLPESGQSPTVLRQSTPTHSANELWTLTLTSAGYVIRNQASGLAITATSKSTGAEIALEAANGSTSQAWKIQ